MIHDATYRFCGKFLDPRSRTVDQMMQAARSGRQNIAEGSRAAATSSQTELRLVNVARSSLEELLLDYEDFLRHRRLPQWHSDSTVVASRGLALPSHGRLFSSGAVFAQRQILKNNPASTVLPYICHS